MNLKEIATLIVFFGALVALGAVIHAGWLTLPQ